MESEWGGVPKGRKVIQLVMHTLRSQLYALCDDGSIWERDPLGGWNRVDGPPTG